MRNLINRILLISILLISGCHTNAYDVDVSAIELKSIFIKRLDQSVFTIQPNTINEKVESMKSEYGNFFTTYLTEMLNNGGNIDSSVKYNLLSFIQDKNIRDCKQAIDKTFNTEMIQKIEKDLALPLKRLKYYFPKQVQPQIVTFVSGWNYAAWYSDNTIAIGLDMYLGEQSEFYKMLGWPAYMVKKCHSNNIVPECVKALSISIVPKHEEMKDLLDNIIYKGKLQFISDVLLPDYQDSLKLNYSGQEMDYLEKYERNIWLFLTEKNRLFDQDPNEIVGYINDGPFTSAISKDCPPRIGIWVGRQIIRAYMKNTKSTIEGLLKEVDSKKILQLAKYKP